LVDSKKVSILLADPQEFRFRAFKRREALICRFSITWDKNDVVMDRTNSDSAAQDVDIDFFVLAGYATDAWRFILSCSLLAVLLTACSLRSAHPVYEADMIVAPLVGDDIGGATSSQSLTSKVLSSLGGGGSGAGADPRFDEFQYKMTSPSVIKAANTDGKLYSWVYPGMWDSRERRWVRPGGIGQLLLGLVRSFFNKPRWMPPDDVMTSGILQKQIIFEQVPKSSLVKVSYQNEDPAIATAMLERLFSVADGQLRAAERTRLRAQIENANSVLATTQISDFKEAMGQALSNAELHLMNVPDNIDYSASKIEAPFVSSVPVAPKIGLSLALSTAVAFILASFGAVAYRIVLEELKRHGKLPQAALRFYDLVRADRRRAS
jgi:hypothetical protein